MNIHCLACGMCHPTQSSVQSLYGLVLCNEQRPMYASCFLPRINLAQGGLSFSPSVSIIQHAGGQHVKECVLTGEAVGIRMIDNETLGYFMARTHQFLSKVGINPARMRFRQVGR
jgi:hypothetical protein